jgi:hypothetical protein
MIGAIHLTRGAIARAPRLRAGTGLSDASPRGGDMADISEIMKVYLAEYDNFRKEIGVRLTAQQQAFTLLLTLLGAALTAAGVLNQYKLTQFGPLLALFLPVVSAPLGFIFFDNEIMIFANGACVVRDLRGRIASLVGSDKIFPVDPIDFIRSRPFANRVHFSLSIGRWILFLLPVILPTLDATWYAIRPTAELKSIINIIYFRLFLVLDYLICALLVMAIIVVIKDHRNWRGL